MEQIIQISASAQDGYTADGSLDNSGNEAFIGNIDAGSPPFTNYAPADTYLFFSSLDIPRGAQIISVDLDVVADGIGNGSPDVLVYANDADDAVIPTDGTDHAGKARTTASVSWSPGAWTAGSTYSPGDLTSLLQEVIDRPGWRPGNDFMLLIDDDSSSDNNYRPIRTYDDTPGDAATLTIKWTKTKGMPIYFD